MPDFPEVPDALNRNLFEAPDGSVWAPEGRVPNLEWRELPRPNVWFRVYLTDDGLYTDDPNGQGYFWCDQGDCGCNHPPSQRNVYHDGSGEYRCGNCFDNPYDSYEEDDYYEDDEDSYDPGPPQPVLCASCRMNVGDEPYLDLETEMTYCGTHRTDESATVKRNGK